VAIRLQPAEIILGHIEGRLSTPHLNELLILLTDQATMKHGPPLTVPATRETEMNDEIVALIDRLLVLGADPNFKGKDGKSAMDILQDRVINVARLERKFAEARPARQPSRQEVREAIFGSMREPSAAEASK